MAQDFRRRGYRNELFGSGHHFPSARKRKATWGDEVGNQILPLLHLGQLLYRHLHVNIGITEKDVDLLLEHAISFGFLQTSDKRPRRKRDKSPRRIFVNKGVFAQPKVLDALGPLLIEDETSGGQRLESLRKEAQKELGRHDLDQVLQHLRGRYVASRPVSTASTSTVKPQPAPPWHDPYLLKLDLDRLIAKVGNETPQARKIQSFLAGRRNELGGSLSAVKRNLSDPTATTDAVAAAIVNCLNTCEYVDKVVKCFKAAETNQYAEVIAELEPLAAPANRPQKATVDTSPSEAPIDLAPEDNPITLATNDDVASPPQISAQPEADNGATATTAEDSAPQGEATAPVASAPTPDGETAPASIPVPEASSLDSAQSPLSNQSAAPESLKAEVAGTAHVDGADADTVDAHAKKVDLANDAGDGGGQGGAEGVVHDSTVASATGSPAFKTALDHSAETVHAEDAKAEDPTAPAREHHEKVVNDVAHKSVTEPVTDPTRPNDSVATPVAYAAIDESQADVSPTSATSETEQSSAVSPENSKVDAATPPGQVDASEENAPTSIPSAQDIDQSPSGVGVVTAAEPKANTPFEDAAQGAAELPSADHSAIAASQEATKASEADSTSAFSELTDQEDRLPVATQAAADAAPVDVEPPATAAAEKTGQASSLEISAPEISVPEASQSDTGEAVAAHSNMHSMATDSTGQITADQAMSSTAPATITNSQNATDHGPTEESRKSAKVKAFDIITDSISGRHKPDKSTADGRLSAEATAKIATATTMFDQAEKSLHVERPRVNQLVGLPEIKVGGRKVVTKTIKLLEDNADLLTMRAENLRLQVNKSAGQSSEVLAQAQELDQRAAALSAIANQLTEQNAKDPKAARHIARAFIAAWQTYETELEQTTDKSDRHEEEPAVAPSSALRASAQAPPSRRAPALVG